MHAICLRAIHAIRVLFCGKGAILTVRHRFVRLCVSRVSSRFCLCTHTLYSRARTRVENTAEDLWRACETNVWCSRKKRYENDGVRRVRICRGSRTPNYRCSWYVLHTRSRGSSRVLGVFYTLASGRAGGTRAVRWEHRYSTVYNSLENGEENTFETTRDRNINSLRKLEGI